MDPPKEILCEGEDEIEGSSPRIVCTIRREMGLVMILCGV